ncbi:hypothetical protein CPB83DRAFT_864422 [Crepidotus variabilis]|uniref:PH domain-containing protein n=1 Tax=Crepidotus variabilis TaxID=179855 RepID=A0A9P6E4N5_9AGAR|nr:hypothetical protein CPB83DRAFT_864422 [Crepidotus variabilis]
MNLNDNHTTLSRATSRASHRSRNSTLSKNQSLIKKNIELIDLKPADVLIERFVAWKVIVKQLSSYFEGIADIENNTARELTKLAGVIQVPFRAGNQFLGEGGLQDVYYDIRNKSRIIADQHADLGRTIDSSIVQHLQKLSVEIKAHIKNVQNDTGKLATSVAKERELSTKLVGELANNISTFKNTPMNLLPKHDPFISNQAVAHQLQRQVLEENLLQKSIVMMQQNSAHFEEGIVRSIQSAWQTFDEWQSRASTASQEVFRSLTTHMASLAPDREWIQFAARSDHLLDPETPLRDPSAINYPLKEDPSVAPVHVGHLERKKRFTRTYSESYYVLTAAGFLHEFSSSDPAVSHTPTFSLFLPTCTLGPPSNTTARAHKFHIEGRKDGTGATKSKSGSLKGLLPIGHSGENAKAWSFRARSRDEMMEWWNDIRMLCARYLVASELVDRTGPVEAAVKSAGYNSEEFEDEEEEEEEEEEVEAAAQTADEGEADLTDEEAGHFHMMEAETAPPGYSHSHHGEKRGVEIGPNGYALEKKHPIPGHYSPSRNAHLLAATNGHGITYHDEPTHSAFHESPNIVRQSSGYPESHHIQPLVHQPTGGTTPVVDLGSFSSDEEAVEHSHARASRSTKPKRKVSQRQMEKAPEGRIPRGSDAGSAIGVSHEEPVAAAASVDTDTDEHIPASPKVFNTHQTTPQNGIHAHDYAEEDTDGEVDGGPTHVGEADDADDIYERESEAEVGQENAATNPTSTPPQHHSIIGSVASTIGNAMRGATGRTSS